MNSSTELKNLFEAMAKAQAEMDVVTKDKSGGGGKYKYAGLDAVIKASRPALTKHGISVNQFVQSSPDGQEEMVTRISHASGEWIESSLRMIISPLAFAKGEITQQAVGSAITYYSRYCYVPAVGVIIEEEDDDGQAAADAISNEKAAKVISLNKPVRPTQNNVPNAIVVHPEAISKDQYDEIINAIELLPKNEQRDIVDKLYDHYKIYALSELPKDSYRQVIDRLRKMRESLAK